MYHQIGDSDVQEIGRCRAQQAQIQPQLINFPEHLDRVTDQARRTTQLTLGDFWAWAYSDVVSNADRSVFAEFMVGTALGLTEKPRVEWDCVDFRYRSRSIEVKSSAYIN